MYFFIIQLIMNRQLQVIKKICLSFLPACVVILFGSRSRNDFNEDIDYDILIITNNEINIEKKRELQAKIRCTLSQYKIPVDILIHSQKQPDIL
jgi:predicted nucleotidyltransferase